MKAGSVYHLRAFEQSASAGFSALERRNSLDLYVEQEERAAIRQTRRSMHLCLLHEKKPLPLSGHIALPYAEKYTASHC